MVYLKNSKKEKNNVIIIGGKFGRMTSVSILWKKRCRWNYKNVYVLWIDGTVSMRHKMNCCFIYNVKMELF